MIIGIGIDVVDISRIEEILQKRADTFVKKYFPCEFSAISITPTKVAGLFAAKEAFIKAVGMGMDKTPLSKICIGYDKYGKPYIYGDLVKDSWKVHVSIAHDGGVAVAMVVIEEV
ncbi:holo-[acyl-carrier-protein] synthase [bacterium 3DAC]|jgi:holo-[acyl-carrier protein] synthase|nr:holo-[acyl-carrier-protein] synthase [Dictyoglomota bacterium]UZN23065.1 holo-[acyl-carrier-protein] synthase [bacterium 3DAC]